ncbi:alkaline ceramidase [Mongoliitalea daihaiensis]|uniref:alkaline ceramidase n=1 Tax=Mongoliitalea daihaiensis TaxID=2782006 RepID=UPI001F4455DC|nr:alkaline ceramidase [Mongoliitalea daihaiensis]UJP66294.1 alkaline ceramidase [Mongoliitalea daihaiensis]
MSPKIKRTFKISAWILGTLFFTTSLLITRVDRSDYKESDYYRNTLQQIAVMDMPESKGKVWLASWGQSNITPSKPLDLLGYKPRGPYEFVQDSSFVKALLISNGIRTVLFLNYEFMIIHPSFQETILNGIADAQLPIDYTFFTATHTHAGLGGHIPGIMGKLAFGGYHENFVQDVQTKTIDAIHESLASLDTADLFFQKSKTLGLVANRLIEGDSIDPYARQLIIRRKDGLNATLLTYSAHPTIVDRKFMGLSGDYPSVLTKELEGKQYDFALFAAGMVGSHKPIADGQDTTSVQIYAAELSRQISGSMHAFSTNKDPSISTALVPIELRKAHYRISQHIRLRPWIFNSLFGPTNPHFDVVKLGNTLFISSSGEISGVFMKAWEDYAKSKKLNLIMTSFNGGYIGYITPDEYYDLPKYEVRDMNWYGPQNGAYFDEMIHAIIDKASK